MELFFIHKYIKNSNQVRKHSRRISHHVRDRSTPQHSNSSSKAGSMNLDDIGSETESSCQVCKKQRTKIFFENSKLRMHFSNISSLVRQFTWILGWIANSSCNGFICTSCIYCNRRITISHVGRMGLFRRFLLLLYNYGYCR